MYFSIKPWDEPSILNANIWLLVEQQTFAIRVLLSLYWLQKYLGAPPQMAQTRYAS